MPKITPFLWFNDNLEAAIDFYSLVFKSAIVTSRRHMGDKLFSAEFELEGQKFLALDGGPMFSFTEAISFFVNCKTQEEVDYYWDRLSEGGEKSRCGWLKDRFGLSWQVIPQKLNELLSDPDRNKANKAMQAMMKMDKIIVADLVSAANS